jgi:DNA-directed RNA polymerase subunit RPC12/RpoP
MISAETERLTELRRLSDNRQLVCPHCGSALLLKAGAQRLHHFAHVTLNTCTHADHEPESEMHRLGKFVLYDHFRGEAREAQLERHFPQTDQRADCFIHMGDSAYALEFQQANNTYDHWGERRSAYRSQQVIDVWFLGSVRYQESNAHPARPLTPYEPLPMPRERYDAAAGGFRIRELERAILDSDRQLIYLDPEREVLTILLPRPGGVGSINLIRAYRYRVPLREARLVNGGLWTPLTPLLADYWRLRGGSVS